MRTIFILALVLSSIYTSGQSVLPDSLLYHLAFKSIEDYQDNGRTYILTFPQNSGDYYSLSRDCDCLHKDDLALISNQIKNPILKSWDNPPFRKAKNIKLVKRLVAKKNVVTISIPIVSTDNNTVVFYVDTFLRHNRFTRQVAGSGIVVIWRRGTDDVWSKESRMLYFSS